MKKLILISAGFFLMIFATVAKAEDKSQAVVNEFNNLVAKATVEYMENEWIVVQGSRKYAKLRIEAWNKEFMRKHITESNSLFIEGKKLQNIEDECDEAVAEIGKWFKFRFEVTEIEMEVKDITFGCYQGLITGKGRSKKGELRLTEKAAMKSLTPDLSSVEFHDFELKYEYRDGKWKFVSFSSEDGQKYTAKEIEDGHCYKVVNGVVFDFWMPDKRF